MTDAERARIDWMNSDEPTCNPLHPLKRPVAEEAFAAGVSWAMARMAHKLHDGHKSTLDDFDWGGLGKV